MQVRDYKFGIILSLWNIFNVCHSIQASYQVLLESNEEIKQILLSKKPDFESCLSKIDQTLMDILIILSDKLDRKRYRKLQRKYKLIFLLMISKTIYSFNTFKNFF